jgi:hypothetical protein
LRIEKKKITKPINRKIRKENKRETQMLVSEYENANGNSLDLTIEIEIAYKLFIATISGDKKATAYFINFSIKLKGA